MLHGTLAPLSGVGLEQLRVKELMTRLMDADAGVVEVVLATPPTVDGEATALFLARNLSQAGVRLSLSPESRWAGSCNTQIKSPWLSLGRAPGDRRFSTCLTGGAYVD